MIASHKHFLFWLSYIVVVAITCVTIGASGAANVIWRFDITGLSSAVLAMWILTEAVGGYQLIKIDQEINQRRNMFAPPDLDSVALWHRHSFVLFMSELVVAAGIFGTVVGVIIALMPFFGLTSFDLNTIQPHLLEMFTGIAVAFFPTALSIVIKISLDIHSRLHQSAVIALLVTAEKLP